MSVHLRPEQIEAESFRIIDAEAGAHGWSAEEWPLVRRAVHTSADFDYVRDLVITPGTVARAVAALRRGRLIVTDTRMAQAGITRARLDPLGIECRCLVDDPVVAKSAKLLGVTRSLLAMRTAAADPGTGIFVIGNAPTALFELIRLIREEGVCPDLIVGLPVGFVGAAESKAELLKLAAEQPQLAIVTNRGRKGGSNVAAAVMNALLIQAAG